MLRTPLLAAAHNDRLKRLVSGAPVTRDVVTRFVAGEHITDAIAASRQLIGQGLLVTLDHLGEDTTSAEQAVAAAAAYCDLLAAVRAAALTRQVELSIKLSSLGLGVDDALAYEHAHQVCAAARAAGSTVTIDMEGHAATERTLALVARLRAEFPDVGAVVQAYLRRTESDCRALAGAASRVRLVKGAYAEPEALAFQSPAEVGASFVRCLAILMDGAGYPMVATHDPVLIEAALRLAGQAGRDAHSYELQMLYGVRPKEQRRLQEEGERVRIYVPYGTEWYGYLMRRLAERPANLAFFVRALASRS